MEWIVTGVILAFVGVILYITFDLARNFKSPKK